MLILISYLYMYPSLLHKIAPFCMNTAKKEFWGRTPRSPFKQNCFRSYYTHKYWKNHYQNISATKYAIFRASSLQNIMQNIKSHVLPPLLNTRTNTPPPFFLLFLKFVAVKNKYPVFSWPGNKFSGRAHDENKYSVSTKSASPPSPSGSNARPLIGCFVGRNCNEIRMETRKFKRI